MEKHYGIIRKSSLAVIGETLFSYNERSTFPDKIKCERAFFHRKLLYSSDKNWFLQYSILQTLIQAVNLAMFDLGLIAIFDTDFYNQKLVIQKLFIKNIIMKYEYWMFIHI